VDDLSIVVRGKQREQAKTTTGERSSPVAKESLEVDDELLLLLGKVAALDSWPEVVCPPQPAALAAPHQPCTRTRGGQKKKNQISLEHGSWRKAGNSVHRVVIRDSSQTGVGRHGAPVSGAVLLDIGDEHEVLLGCPWPFLHSHLVAARRPPHATASGLFRSGRPAAELLSAVVGELDRLLRLRDKSTDRSTDSVQTSGEVKWVGAGCIYIHAQHELAKGRGGRRREES